MNRAQRRAKGIKNNIPTYNINAVQLEEIKQKATNEAIDAAFFLMLAIPTMVIHDKYPKLMKKEGREQTFVDLCLDLYDSFKQGYVTLDELQDCLQKETNLTWERIDKK